MEHPIKELIIIGAGPIGLACGIAAKRAGIHYLILDKGALVNSLYNYPLFMTFFSTAERLEIGGIPFTCTQAKPGRQEALEYYRKVAVKENLQLQLYTTVNTIQKNEEDLFQIVTSKGELYAKNIVIATGFYDIPYQLNIPGEDLEKVHHYYKEPHPFAFQKIVVVGAQNSAVDAALETWRRGAEVTMVVRRPEIGERVKYWQRPDIVNRIEEGSIRAYFNSNLLEIKEKSVLIQTPDEVIEIENDAVMAMTGYRPDFKLLEQLNVKLSNDGKMQPFYHADTMESNVKGLYLAGVICGGTETHKWFIENSKEHADLIAQDILKKKEARNIIL